MGFGIYSDLQIPPPPFLTLPHFEMELNGVAIKSLHFPIKVPCDLNINTSVPGRPCILLPKRIYHENQGAIKNGPEKHQSGFGY